MEITASTMPTLLIVDDKPANIALLSDMLEGLADIYFVDDSTKAFDKAVTLQPDIILLDIEMPGMSGFDVCKLLKNNPQTAAISVIFISAHTEAEVEFHSLAYGAVDFIGRPFNRAICRLRVQNHLMLQQQAKALLESKQHLYAEKQRLQVTLNSIGDAVIATDIDAVITFMNPIAERMTGWHQADAMGKPINEVMLLRDAETKQPSLNPIILALKEQRNVAMALDCELVHCNTLQSTAVEDSAAPIFDLDGKMLGAIIVFHDVGEAKALATKMSFLANHDPLTGLPNRILLHDRLEQACCLATMIERKVGLILIDVDQFKFLNDSLGHQSGDELLQLLVKRLQSILEPEHTLARIGGDEFVLIYPDIVQVEQISNLAQNIARISRQPYELNNKKYTMSLSMGISLYPTDSSDAETLLRHADVALFKAKQEGRNRYCFFSDELGQRMLQRHQQEQSLREAIAEERLEVHFQPKVSLADGSIIGAEALVRIRNQNGTLMSPAEFIPLAEETGLIIPLGKTVLIKACQQSARWQHAGITIPVSVNIAAAQFTDPGLLGLIEHLLQEYRLAPELLELEVTETALIDNPGQTAKTLSQFRALGISIAIDDFGTGYSSLAYLKQFKVDVLKIDMSFVKDMLADKNDYAIVKTIILLGQSMQIALVAEGVETAEHQAALLALGCCYGQGYYYSKPLSADNFMCYLQAGKASD